MLLSGLMIFIKSVKNSLKTEQVHEACSDSHEKTTNYRTGGSIAIVRRTAMHFTLDIGFPADWDARS